jgi:hypothetical protein
VTARSTKPKTSLDQSRRGTDTTPPPKPSGPPNTEQTNVGRPTGIGRPELQAMIERFARFEGGDRPLFDGPTPGRSGSALARSFGPA